jgi:hypothetical protein
MRLPLCLYIDWRRGGGPEPELATAWLYDVLAEQWSRWLPADAQADLRRAGSFTMLLEPVRAAHLIESVLCMSGTGIHTRGAHGASARACLLVTISWLCPPGA